jgi:hypothetical protein
LTLSTEEFRKAWMKGQTLAALSLAQQPSHHVGQGEYSIDQVLGHAGFESRPAHDQMQPPHLGRQEYHSLAGGVTRADERNLLTLAELRLNRRGPVGDSRALEHRQVRHVRPPIACPRRDNDNARADDNAGRKFNAQGAILRRRGVAAVQVDDLQRKSDLRAELLCLIERWPEMPVGNPG